MMMVMVKGKTEWNEGRKTGRENAFHSAVCIFTPALLPTALSK